MNKFKAAIEKAWNFVKENKKVIIFATTVAGGTILLATLESQRVSRQLDKITNRPPMPLPTYRDVDYKSEIGEVAEVYVVENDKGVANEVELMINCVKTEDLGKLGEEIINNIPEVKPDQELSLWINGFGLTSTTEIK